MTWLNAYGFERADLDGLLELMDQNYIGWAQYFAPLVAGSTLSQPLTAEISNSFCSTDLVMARLFAEVTFFSDIRDQLQHCTTPSLILQHRNDALVPLSVGDYLLRRDVGQDLHENRLIFNYPLSPAVIHRNIGIDYFSCVKPSARPCDGLFYALPSMHGGHPAGHRCATLTITPGDFYASAQLVDYRSRDAEDILAQLHRAFAIPAGVRIGTVLVVLERHLDGEGQAIKLHAYRIASQCGVVLARLLAWVTESGLEFGAVIDW